MSRRLRNLEDKMGVRLFDRTPQGLRPTSAGLKLIPLTDNMRRAADEIARAMPGLSSHGPMTVRIAVDEIREHFLTSHLAQLREMIDDVPLEIFSDHEHPDHESRKTDVQIRACLPESETLIAKRIGHTEHGLYVHKSLAPGLSFEDLATMPYIGFAPDQLWYPVQKHWLEKNFIGKPTLRVNTMTGMLNAVAAGQGLAVLPKFMACERSDLLEIATKEAPPVTTEYLIVHRDLLREKAVRIVVDALTQIYRAHRRGVRDA